jgi:glycosyltransferase involved in cell wall biosynthesis
VKVAHLAIVTPNQCGLYETTRELVVGLRELGVDSRLIDIPDSNKIYSKGYPEKEDRGAPVADMAWAVGADIIVNHSGYDNTPVEKTEQPIVHVAHGRPMSGFLTEDHGNTKICTYQYNRNSDPRWKAVVTFWPEHMDYLEFMFPDVPVYHVQACVDLDYWTDGAATYEFHGTKGGINVICTDPKRDDNNAFLPTLAFARWQEKEAKLHIFGTRETGALLPLFMRLNQQGRMGCIVGWSSNLRSVYRSADLMITSSGIDTRSVREAMACGCPTLQVTENFTYIETDFCNTLSRTREQVRLLAEQQFNPNFTALQFQRVLNNVSKSR